MLREAWRTLVRMPVVSSVIVFSLAAGIGVNTVVFSWIQSRMLSPMPAVDEGARFHGIETKNQDGRYPGSSWLEYEDLRDGLRSFDAVIAFGMAPLYIGDPGEVQRAFGVLTSGDYFHALGLRPQAGRFFTVDEAGARAPVAVISHGVWQSRFGGRRDISGQRLRVNGVDMTITGVAPRDFHGTVLGLSFDIWVPATNAPMLVRGTRELEDRRVRSYSVLGRLRNAVSRDEAQAEAAALMSRLAAAYPDTNAGLTAEVVPFWNSPRGPNRLLNAALLVLQAVMLLVLVAVCGNTANLVLARASARQKEIGVRLALGARPWRVARLLIVENLMLGALGALGGAAIAIWGTEALKVIPLSGLPIRLETSVDTTGLAFALALGLLSGVLLGAVPAPHLARMDPAAALRGGAKTASHSRLRNALMASQVALAVIVLIAAALFLRGFLATRTEKTGFHRDGVLLAAYDLAGRDASSDDARQFAARLLERVRALPSVQHAAIASAVPLDIHGFPLRAFTLEGRTRVEEGEDAAFVNVVTPAYFETMGIALEEGSDFAPLTDTAARRQVIVNRTFVRAFVGEGSTIGRRLEARGRTHVISGVVADSLYNAFGEPPTPMIYFSYRDRPSTTGEIHVRATPGAQAALTARLQAIVRELDVDLPLFNVRTLAQHVDTNLVFRRIPARMFAFLGPLLLVLAAIGIYAVVAYSMSLRTMEVGLRLALGASPRRVVSDFIAETMMVIIAGAAVGWLLAWMVATQAMGDAEIDVQVFAGVPALLLSVAAFACWLPAHRAAKLDPWQALR